eukprot:TRINITY_DN11659_c0_g1_i1.p1 TRINITY_DN11659_c0_g1~~TRINITY_DN11659_c0_g1_i1.p1  ORF type:complete len:807 (-),score=169.02 TRINITY_DN11659_c0_g1_i1:163-2583(-)
MYRVGKTLSRTLFGRLDFPSKSLRSIHECEIASKRLQKWIEEESRQRTALLACSTSQGQPVRLSAIFTDATAKRHTHVIQSPTPLSPLEFLNECKNSRDVALAAWAKNWKRSALVALVNGKPVDLTSPISCDSELEFADFTSTSSPPTSSASPPISSVTQMSIGGETLCHSAAHLMGQALEYKYADHSVLLNDGPAVKDDLSSNFFYDVLIVDKRNGKPLSISAAELDDLTSIMGQLARERQPFQRMVVSKTFALDLFSYNPLKLRILQSLPDTEPIVLYRNGSFVDMCRGPHIPNTSYIHTITATRVGAIVSSMSPPSSSSSSSSFSSLSSLPQQRVSGLAFPNKEISKKWKSTKDQALRLDHRLLGQKQELFFFHPLSAGSVFFLPHGTRIYSKLVNFLRSEYRERGYEEVLTPLMYDQQLWQISGHWDHYQDNMFLVSNASTSAPSNHSADCCSPSSSSSATTVSKEEKKGTNLMGLKPMNCPAHCLMFASRIRSYRELPIRFADFGQVMRNEASGALSGLTRVRQFTQDDAHVFCRMDQVQAEVLACLQFVDHVYRVLGFRYKLRLSTRPESSIGDSSVWSKAQQTLIDALKANKLPFEMNVGDGAFYAPKIDLFVLDALMREHQCATIQLDFNLPSRFKLSYKGADQQYHTPVIIHRAILGSLERMIGILTEQTGGKWPFWLSPRQVIVCSVSERNHCEYANQVAAILRKNDFFVDVDNNDHGVAKKVRDAQAAGYNVILVVGDTEMKENSVSVRLRDRQETQVWSMARLVAMLQGWVKDKRDVVPPEFSTTKPRPSNPSS